MRLSPLHASLMSLALFALAGPVAAAAAETEHAVILAQAETPAAEPEQPPPAEVQPEPQPEPQQEAAPEPQPEPQQQAAPEPAPQESSEVALFLQSVRPASELSDDELRRQMQQAMALAETEGLSKDQRRALRDVIREARAELKSRADNQAAETQAPAETQQETPPEAQQQAEPEAQPQPQVEPPAAEQQQQAQPPVVEEPPQEAAKTVEVDPALEVEARALIEDNVDARDLNRRELRKRLASMRELLASEKLSPQTSDALRQKLAAEREVLRSEVSAEEGQTPPVQPQAQQQEAQQPQAQQPQQGGSTVNNNVVINNTTTITNTEIQVVLNDRRPPDLLEDDELVRRIDIYRDVVRDDRYDMEEREAWRRALERDRRYLRRQMLAEREEREARLRRGEFELSIEIYDDYDPGRDYQDDVFAAEVEDEELADVLAAPPRRKVERRYTVDEIERSSTARDSVARIEIDTVNFGFGEGFLREEEIDKLDRIARVLERILARNPDEVFLIEGHTDAVGSAGSNLQLSRERAAAVKEALTTYYVIPAENLKTVGLGERYLKIPTLEAEAENRRVSLARITSLVSRAD